MTESKNYEEFLHQYGLKNTRPRRRVLEILFGQEELLTAEEIYQELLEAGETVNVSTVYRVLELFTEKKLVEKTFLPETRKYAFSLRMPGHVHYLICIRCHKKVDLSGCPLSDYERKVAANTGFDIIGHRLELYGLCKECRDKDAAGGTEQHE